MRTIGIVTMAAALVVLSAGGMQPGQPGFAEVSRVVQGILAGVGFIGAGVIVRGSGEGQVHGLTTAAVVWLGAGMGVLCGIGAWSVLVPAVVLVFVLLTLGGPAERWVQRHYGPGDGGR